MTVTRPSLTSSPCQREPLAVADQMADHQLCQSKPSETESSSEVEEGLATLEQEQQLWRPGVKAEQVREFLLVLKNSLFFGKCISRCNYLNFQENC